MEDQEANTLVKSHSPGTCCVPVSGSGIGTAGTKKALLALLTFPVWYRGYGCICNYSLGVLQRKSGDNWAGWGWGAGGEVSFLEEEPFSQGFGEWEELGAEISPEKR